MTSELHLSKLADHVRNGSKLVDDYLEYARQYGIRFADLAESVVAEVMPDVPSNPDECLLVSMPLTTEKPSELKARVQAVRAGANVTRYVVCRRTMTLYFFGTPKKP